MMANDLVTTQRNPIQVMGSALVRANAHPGLSEADGSRPRTILIGRMLAGAGESDLLMANLLCLPRSELFGIALFGEPAGPTFKAHPQERRARFEADDTGAVGSFIDWRLNLPDTTVVASFDPSCAVALIEALEILRGDFPYIPVDVIFLAGRDEQEPGLLAKLRQQEAGKVIVARTATMSSSFESSQDVNIPVLPKILAAPYQSGHGSLRTLAAGLPVGSRASFASALRRFAIALEGQLQ